MGACGSSMTAEQKAEALRSKQLEAEAKKQMQQDRDKLKLLLLGAGESGKSTLFKQMKLLYGIGNKHGGFSDSEIQASVKTISNNVISNFRILLINCESHTPAVDTALADELLQLEEGIVIDEELGTKLQSMWSDPGVQETWLHRNDMQIQDSLEYYIENMDRIKKQGYTPSNQDILRTRVRTSGIVEQEFLINDVKVAMFDVGGQRNERKKWIHCFDNVTAVIFVAAISEYDQVLYEDSNTGRQEEALNLFTEMSGSSWFSNKSMILFLNKRDLFRKKLQYAPFKIPADQPGARNTDYNGPLAIPGTASSKDGTPEFEAVYNACTQYLIDLYKNAGRAGNPKREIYIKVTCATDTDQVKVVMESCKDIILKSNLQENGFM